jgi:hypothetical protein
MKSIRIVGLCLASLLAMGMALAGNASAALLWLLCLEGSGLTKYSSNQCTEASSTGKWQSLGLPSGVSDTVRLLAFSLRLEDANAATVECTDAGTGWGLIESPNKAVIKVAEITKSLAETRCQVLRGFLTCTVGFGKVTGVHGTNLPWTIEIFETEKKNLTQIKGKNATERPGWAVECAGATDECIEEEGEGHHESAELLNGVTSGVLLVLARFENHGVAKCSIGGAKEGHVYGLIAILLWNGNGLSINPV